MPAADPVAGTAAAAAWNAARADLRAGVARALDQWSHRPDSLPHRLVRVSVPAPSARATAWLCAQANPVKVYWQGRGDLRITAAVGVADRVRGTSARDYASVLARCRLFAAEGARYYGGFAFDEGSSDDPRWVEFGPAQFWLPRVEYVTTAEGSRLVCNLLLRADVDTDAEALFAEIDALAAPVDPPRLPEILTRRDAPNPENWAAAVNAALGLIRAGALEKIVLARKAAHRFAAPVDASVLLARLERVTSNCFHFCLQPSAHAAFVGTTPECLFRREGRHLQTEVIAGTRGRSDVASEDTRLSEDLLNSEKDQREHDIVRKFLRQRLHLSCETVDVQANATLLKLERKQHLYSGVSARLKPGEGDASLLESLHPTPAVGGFPSENARMEIRRLEPFRRGWYAAPVGWVSAEACEFAVAIRSGLVQGDEVLVYSGAGIVEGSVPAEEWDEIENKISDFRKVTAPTP